jgi:flagellar FliJ protein
MSPKFKFKLEPVLKYRNILEKKEAKEFAKLHKKYDEECGKLDLINTNYKNTQKELEVKKRAGIDIKELKTYYTYLNSLNLDIKAQQLKVKEAEAKKEEQRKKLVNAQKDKKVIDKLKDNKYNEFKEEERKDEIKTIDDINSITTARTRKT